MLNPNGGFRRVWDTVQAILLVYVALLAPWRICFNIEVEVWSGWFLLDLCVDLYFWADLVVNFRTGECQQWSFHTYRFCMSVRPTFYFQVPCHAQQLSNPMEHLSIKKQTWRIVIYEGGS